MLTGISFLFAVFLHLQAILLATLEFPQMILFAFRFFSGR